MGNNYKKSVITIIGAGRVGTSLALRLTGKKFEVKYVIEKSRKNSGNLKKLFDKIILLKELSLDVMSESDVIIICTKDDDIRSIVSLLCKFKVDYSKKIIFHTSGSESSLVFKSLNIPGKNTGSFHPVQTFNEISRDSGKYFKNIFIAAEGGSEFLRYAENLCKVTEAKLITITPREKEMYHLICVYLSNYLISYFKSISEIGKQIGIPENKFLDIFSPLIDTTFKNLKEKGFGKSLTGPIERGDVTTILKHKKCLLGLDKRYSELYKLLGLEALKIAVSKKSLNKTNSKIIAEILNK